MSISMQTLTDFDSAPFEIIDGDRGKNYPKQHELAQHLTGGFTVQDIYEVNHPKGRVLLF